MNLLVVTNLYPPHVIGGYEIGCQEVVEGLRGRGHSVTVLTSWYGLTEPASDGNIFRILDPHRLNDGMDRSFRVEARREWNEQFAFRALCRKCKPDLIYFWNMGHIPISLLFLAKKWRIPSACYISDEWPARWKGDLWYRIWQALPQSPVRRRLFLRSLRILGLFPFEESLVLDNPQFTSDAVRKKLAEDLSFHNDRVIHWGVDCDRFVAQSGKNSSEKVLYVGQVMPHKGTKTAVEAIRILRDEHGRQGVSLSVAGGSKRPDYVKEIETYIAEHGLTTQIDLLGAVRREDLPELYSDHELFIFPSVWREPFSIAVVEALASGLAVVGTDTGGSSEILQDSVNCLTFSAGDAAACASQLNRLLENDALRNTIKKNARHAVETQFSFTTMLDRIEEALQSAAGDRRSARQGGIG